MSVSHIPTFTRTKLVTWARRNTATLLIVLGALLLAYVGFEYTQMFWGQKRLEHEWARQQQQQKSLQSSSGSVQPAALKDDGLTRLSIPSISFDAVVVEGTSHHALLLGPGHVEDTPAPGEIGNSVISGHRDTFFRHIHELEKGDHIIVQRNGKQFHYEVTGKHIVQPTDVSVLKPSKDAELTLITCYPTYYIGPAPERLIVTSKLVDDSPQGSLSPAAAAMNSSAQKAVH